jgi:hypothetical protein
VKLRQKTNLDTAIIWDGQTRTSWMHVSYSTPEYEGMPKEVGDHYRQHAIRELDVLLGDGMIDAMQAGWIVLPPVQAREFDRWGYGFPEVNRHVIERRVRVERPSLRDQNYGSWAVARVQYTLEPQDYRADSLTHPWFIYEPEIGADGG